MECASFVPPFQLSNFTRGGTCNLCQAKLSGAITMATCGHIFHERCVKKWKTDICPHCEDFIDEPTEQAVYAKEVPVWPKGTLVMLQGFSSEPSMNGTLWRIIDHFAITDRYLIEQKTSLILRIVKPSDVVWISPG